MGHQRQPTTDGSRRVIVGEDLEYTAGWDHEVPVAVAWERRRCKKTAASTVSPDGRTFWTSGRSAIRREQRRGGLCENAIFGRDCVGRTMRQARPGQVGDVPRLCRWELKKITSGDSAFEISDNGVIVGYGTCSRCIVKAVVWPSVDAPMILLDSFLKKNGPFTELNQAWGVNDAGDIVGFGWDNDRGINPGFLAIPE